MKAFDYAIAENVAGALEAMSRGYKLKAGGIDLLDLLKERTADGSKHDSLVSIHQLKDLRGIRMDKDAIVISPMTTLNEMGADPILKRSFPGLAQAAGEAATPQIRAVATAGGNLCQRPRCWYFRSSDFNCLKKGGSTCYALEGENQYHALFGGGPCHIVHPSNIAPPLVAAGAEFVVRNKKESRTIKAQDFFVLPASSLNKENVLDDGDLIVEIRVPKPPEKSAFVEFREKQSFDWPLAACAAVLLDGKWNVVLGGVAPIPWRAKKSEEALAGARSIDKSIAERAADAALDQVQPMSQNAWRKALVRAAVRRALLLAEGKEID